MVRFIKLLQLLIAIVVGFFIVKDTFLYGIGIFAQTWVIISIVTTLLLELALQIIIKLVEDD